MTTSQKKITRNISREFAQLLDEIKNTRVLAGTDDLKHIKADWRITIAMMRHPKMNEIKEDIINASLE